MPCISARFPWSRAWISSSEDGLGAQLLADALPRTTGSGSSPRCGRMARGAEGWHRRPGGSLVAESPGIGALVVVDRALVAVARVGAVIVILVHGQALVPTSVCLEVVPTAAHGVARRPHDWAGEKTLGHEAAGVLAGDAPRPGAREVSEPGAHVRSSPADRPRSSSRSRCRSRRAQRAMRAMRRRSFRACRVACGASGTRRHSAGRNHRVSATGLRRTSTDGWEWVYQWSLTLCDRSSRREVSSRSRRGPSW